MRLHVRQRLEQRFHAPQPRLVQLLRLTPPSLQGQSVVDWRLDLDRDARLRARTDGFGNLTTLLYLDGPLDQLVLTVTGEVLTDDMAGVLRGQPEPLPPVLFTQVTRFTTADAALLAFGREADDADPLARAHRLADLVTDRIAAIEHDADGTRPAAAVLDAGSGGSADLAHLLVAAARAAGIPARVTCGFRHDADAGECHRHAWAELLVDGYGWIGFDPRHGRCADDRYIRVATGLDLRDAAPLSGGRFSD